MIYRKVIEMYYIDRLLMSILALLSRPGFFVVWIEIWILDRLHPARPPWRSAAVYRLASYPHRSDPFEP